MMPQPAQQPVQPGQPVQPRPAQPQAGAKQATQKDKDTYDRIIIAGKKILYSGKTHGKIMKLMQAMADDPAKMLVSVTLKIMGWLKNEKNMPESAAVIPAAMEIMMLVAELAQADRLIGQMDKESATQASQQLLAGLMQLYGISQEQMVQAMQSMGGQPGQPAEQAPEQMPPEQTRQPGLISSRMGGM